MTALTTPRRWASEERGVPTEQTRGANSIVMTPVAPARWRTAALA